MQVVQKDAYPSGGDINSNGEQSLVISAYTIKNPIVGNNVMNIPNCVWHAHANKDECGSSETTMKALCAYGNNQLHRSDNSKPCLSEGEGV